MKPQLAISVSLEDLAEIFQAKPLIMQPKYDGVRCLVIHGKAMARSLKPITNRYIRDYLSDTRWSGLDGELTVLDWPPNEINSVVASREGEPDFTYNVFDLHNVDMPYRERLSLLKTREMPKRAKRVPWEWARSIDQVLAFEEKLMSGPGYDGLIFRTPGGMYKQGRSTMSDGGLWRFKRFEDSEGVIIGWDAEMQNNNEKTRNELGRAKRSSHRENKVAKESLGAFTIRDNKLGWEFDLGTGFTREQREQFWRDRKKLHGKYVKYRYCPAGVKDKPRWPSFIGFRDKKDM